MPVSSKRSLFFGLVTTCCSPSSVNPVKTDCSGSYGTAGFPFGDKQAEFRLRDPQCRSKPTVFPLDQIAPLRSDRTVGRILVRCAASENGRISRDQWLSQPTPLRPCPERN